MIKEKKPKKPFRDGHRKYDPKTEGFGNPEKWRAAFKYRMGLDEAKRVLQDTDPLTVLGLTPPVTWHQIERAYKKLVVRNHPDWTNADGSKGGDAENFKRIQAAYEILEAKYHV